MSRVFVLLTVVGIALGCDSSYRIWIPRSSTADPLYRFIKDGKAGYIDSTGKVVVAPQLDLLGSYRGEFHDGLLEIDVSNGKYVDRTGELVIDKGLFRGWDFSEGLAVAMRKNEDLWGYIDTSGQFAISPRFHWSQSDYVWPFTDGLAKIKVHDRYGFIDHSGEFVIQPHLPDATDFHDGMARVVMEGPCVYFPEGACGPFNPVFVGSRDKRETASCKFSYIDKKGNLVTKARFDDARDFSEGLAPVRIGALWAFIDKTGSMVIPPRFEDAEPFHSGLSRIRVHELYGYADQAGNIVIEPKYKEADDFSEGFAVVGDGFDYWYINDEGKQTIQGKFEVASPFFKGLAHVRVSSADATESFAYINHGGKRVFTYQYTSDFR
ncbi:MAG: hypothetical protein C5B58_13170 [Acidobacteria bacterium]|nr:MAG: hypothetical protein C5B58_13170 [Acidobacteriota bacterium]